MRPNDDQYKQTLPSHCAGWYYNSKQ